MANNHLIAYTAKYIFMYSIKSVHHTEKFEMSLRPPKVSANDRNLGFCF